ncbi:MAG: PAS domain S-box protein [Bacteroidetes bacterium]|nr:PAS domain S-box protein [Bacteroidota bacterium]
MQFPSISPAPVPARKKAFSRRLIAAFIAALLTLLVAGTFAFRTVIQLSEDYDTVTQAYDVIRELHTTVADVAAGQTELRTFYLTQDSSSLHIYRMKMDSVRVHLDNVRQLIAANPEQLQTFKALQRVVEVRAEFNEEKIDAVVMTDLENADRRYPVKTSQDIMRRIDSLAAVMESLELRFLSERKLHTTNQTNRTLLLIGFGGFVSIMLMAIVFLFLMREVRHRTKAEKEVRDSEKRFISFLETVPAGIYIMTADGTPYYANEEAKKILGAGILPGASAENLPEVYRAYVQGTDTPYPADALPIVRALRGERSTVTDVEIWKPDAVVPLFITGAPIYNSDGALQYAMAAFVDIAEQKRAQQQLAESEERFRQIIENASDIIYRTDEHGRFTYVNPVGLTMFGYTMADVKGMHFTMFVNADDQQRIARLYYRQMISRTKSSYHEFSAVKSNGEHIILGQSVELLFEKNTVVGFLAIARNITAQKLIEEEIQRRQQQLDTVVSTVDEGITLSDQDGRFEIFNAKMEELTGYTKEEANTGEFTKLLYPDPAEQRKGLDRLGEVVSKGSIHDVETTIRTKQGEERTLLISTRIVHVKETVMFLSAYRDITSRKRFEEELKQAKEAAESATLAKSLFLATMSHEIRTPMNGVIGMTDLLMQTTLTDEQREYTEIIRTSGETLLTLINDILDFSKIESGKLDMERRPVEVQALIEETFDLVARRAVEKRIDLVYLVDPGTPPYIIGDPIRLRQILLNLTNNAVKFTEKGEVFVSVKELQRENDLTTLQFSVKDTGIGISREQAEKLFQPFTQVDASTTRKFGGTGLGLAITRRLVEMLGGTVWVQSEEGKGAEFFFTLRVPTSTAGDSQPRKYMRGKVPELAGKRLLLVDDNETNLNILSIQCTNWGMHARATSSQHEALQWLKAGDPFDVAIIDFHMPEMDGLELARAIRTHRSEAELPIILFSSSGRSEFTEEENALFAAVVLKPLKQMNLYTTLVDVLSRTGTADRQRRESMPAKVEPLADSVPLRILIAEDNLINQKLALRLLQQLGYTADVVANGREVLSIIAEKRYDIILMDLHMPLLDGLETTRTILRTVDPSLRPKIVAMTADAMSGDRERCIDAGMDDYLSKPVRLDGLRDVLKHYGEMILEAKRTNDHGSPKRVMFLRLKELLEQTDAEFMTAFVQSYPAQSEEIMQQLDAAWRARSIGEIVFVVHKLRGLALSFGADTLADLCRTVEQHAEKDPGIITDERLGEIHRSLRESYEMLAQVISDLGIV